MAKDLIKALSPKKVQNNGKPLVTVGITDYYHYAKDVVFAADGFSVDQFTFQLEDKNLGWFAIPFATVINGRTVTLHFLSDVAPIAGGGGGGGGDKDVKALLEDGIIVTVLTSKP